MPEKKPVVTMYSEPKLKGRKAAEMLGGGNMGSGNVPSKNLSKSQGTHLIIPSEKVVVGSNPGKASVCLCSPTTHAGSFRCRLHRSSQTQWAAMKSKGADVTVQPETCNTNTVEAQ